MYSHTNSENRTDILASTSTISSSPYNLHRNSAQPGAITKRSSSIKSQKDFTITTSQRLNDDSQSAISYAVSNRSQLPLTDKQRTNDINFMNSTDCSDDEEDAVVFTQQVARQNDKPPSVWAHFNYIDRNVYLCKMCLKPIKISNGDDANLRGYLGRIHKMTELMFNSQRHTRTNRSIQIKSDKKRMLHEAAIECIITNGRSFGDFRRLGMSKFLDVICPGYHGLTRKTVRRRLGLSYHTYRQELRTTLASVDAIALTIDIWTKKRTSFICLTRYAFNNTYESIPIVLGFRYLSGSHQSNNIKNYILYELQKLQIQDKICVIVSDNGSDIKGYQQYQIL